jgi:hypothetical protein
VAPRAQGTREWPTYPIKAAPNELRPSIQYGDSIILSIQTAVLSELSRELADVGPAGAVRGLSHVCQHGRVLDRTGRRCRGWEDVRTLTVASKRAAAVGSASGRAVR